MQDLQIGRRPQTTTPPRCRLPLAAAALVLTLAGSAQAQSMSPPPQYRTSAAQAPASPMLDLSTPRSAPALSYAQAAAMRQAGIARTSLDHRVGDGLTGSVGFLCGLQPRLDEASGAAFGIDPHGRFLGAKISRAF